MSKLSYTGYSKELKKEITIVSNGTELQLKKQLYYFFKPDAVLTICEFGNRNVRLDELKLKDIFSNPYEMQKVKEFKLTKKERK